MAVFVIAWGSGEAFLRIVGRLFSRVPKAERREIYLRYLHWLVAALTFQLAADLVHIVLATTWKKLGNVAAIAVIRTFLSYFLDRDLRAAASETRP
jgi:uncharacterized membrane protein